MKATAWVIVSGAMLAAVTASAIAADSGDEQRLRDLDVQWSQAAASKDPVKTASFYADDAAMLPFNSPIVTGGAKIQEAWAGLMARPGYALHFKPTRIVVARSRDMAYDLGTFEITLNDEHGHPVTTTGKYLVAWVKQKNGDWKAAVDSFNTDK